MVSLFFLLGVSAKHFKDDVSTTVSQNETTGSATLMSTKQIQTITGNYVNLPKLFILACNVHVFTNFRIHFSQIMHHAIKVQLPSTKDNMFSRFFNFLGQVGKVG